ncbi:MAG TPA: hypothetical protein VGX25_03885 [Actinophytocola sp.]|uniref:hypothetical protein n=1 Tax=Actinophytocola sp. TaxID=1872138 RepID=UPI002DDD1608|nr:hypothetical protein [Actinophytocola sp.]HEV2778518.1 hypothetical protein [Actinophytocola sp.]
MTHREQRPSRRRRMPWWGHALVGTLMVSGPIAAVWSGIPILGLVSVLVGWVALDLIEKTLQHRAGSR